MKKNKRFLSEVNKLIQRGYEISSQNKEHTQFHINFKGPKDSLYTGTYTVSVTVPEDYPYKSPSVGFVTKMYHPNIDEHSGSICLDVLNQIWSPMYGLENIVGSFLPHLLQYPNASDPLNGDAAGCYLNDLERFKSTVEEFKKRYCPKEINEDLGVEKEEEIESEDLDL